MYYTMLYKCNYTMRCQSTSPETILEISRLRRIWGTEANSSKFCPTAAPTNQPTPGVKARIRNGFPCFAAMLV